MRNSTLSQHLTIKNIFIAIVALNLLNVLTTTRLGGTFEHTARPPAVMTKEAVTPRALDQNTFAHIVPGDALPDGFERRVTAPKPAGHSAPGRVKPQRTSSTPPVVSWLFLLMAAAMALYARYLATQMVQNAVFHAVDSVKQIAGALTKLGDSGRAPSKPLDMARQTAPHPKAGASPPRKNTVVRASRWPFAN